MTDFAPWFQVGRGLANTGAGIANDRPFQAAQGALSAGAAGANLADYPGIAQLLGGAGGPLSLLTNLLSGNWGGAALAAPSALAGGTALAGATGAAVPAGLGAAAGIAGALAPYAAMFLPAIYDTQGNDFFDSLFGGEKSHAQKQHEEFQSYADAFPDLARRRVAGASLFDTLGQGRSPQEIQDALATATSGLRANTEPAAWNLSHSPHASHDKPVDLSEWFKVSPELGGRNAAAFANLMDKAQNAGLDIGSIAGKEWSLNPTGDLANNQSLQDYQTRLGHAQNSWDRDQTQEAQDVGNLVSGIGAALGIDTNHRQDPADNNNVRDYGNFDESSLAGYGLTPGHYGMGIMNYLRSLDPSIVNSPKWAQYTAALGDPSSEAPLQIQPRAPTFTPPSLDRSGGEPTP